MSFLKKHLELLSIFLILLPSPLFFYKLGQSSLVSFDEAWYGAIARKIVESGDLLNLTFNFKPYFDHPPFGFWLMALSIKILGVSELAVRFPSALLGLVSLVVLYFLGKEIFGRVIGLASAIALSSSFWFIFRARSGNLDVPLTFLFLLTFLLAFKSLKSKKYLIPLGFCLGCLMLTKTIVPFTVLPVLIVIFWKSKLMLKNFIWPVFISTLLFGGWFLNQTIHFHDFWRSFFKIGLPGIKLQSGYLSNLKLSKDYLYNGIGRWFWPGIMGVILGPIFSKKFLWLTTFFLCFFIPFIFSGEGHIWHLVPLHPILILAFFGFTYELGQRWIKIKMLNLGLLLFAFGLSFIQIRQMWLQFIDLPAFVSDEEILSKEAGKYPDKFFIDGDFVPSAAFYSNKETHQISRTVMGAVFKTEPSFVMITYQWRLDEAKILPNRYQILKADRDKILIQKR